MKANTAIYLLLILTLVHQCTADIPHCKTVNPETPDKCKECEPRFGLNSDKSACLSCPPSCLRCAQTFSSGSMYCIECEDNQFVYGGICYTCPANCLQCQDGRGCIKCADKNMYTGGDPYRTYATCKVCDANCKSDCVNGSGCLTCKDGFYRSGDYGSYGCSACSSNCLQCSSSSYCTECAPGYYTDYFYFSKTCSACKVKNCKTCTSYSCSECMEGTTMYKPLIGDALCDDPRTALSYTKVLIMILVLFATCGVGILLMRFFQKPKNENEENLWEDVKEDQVSVAATDVAKQETGN